MSFKAAIYELSAGDINNANIRFATAPFLYSPTVVGDTNVFGPAKDRLLVTFVPGATTKHWLYGDKKILNNRTAVTRAFFTSIGAVAGSKLLISRTGARSVEIRKF